MEDIFSSTAEEGYHYVYRQIATPIPAVNDPMLYAQSLDMRLTALEQFIYDKFKKEDEV